jgi:Protein of unknown function (DUF3570)
MQLSAPRRKQATVNRQRPERASPRPSFRLFTVHCSLFTVLALCGAPHASAGVLPDDRADVLYHQYDGGGVTIDGPSLLVRKKFAEKYSVTANYYVDMVSSASIDVVTTASPYKEERTQESVGFDYLRGKTTYSLGYTNSSENDYTADTASFSLSQDMFGDLTTLSLGFSRGWDDVSRRGDAEFAATVDRRNYSIGLSQILTKQLIMGLSYEVITDEGFLNNPYRQVRYVDPDEPRGYSFQPEQYPHTRTSNAVAIRSKYFLPYRAAIEGEYRYYGDTWGIGAHTAEIGYTHPTGPWIFEVRYRYYRQSNADFYSDLFPRVDALNFLARDKELSTFQSHTLRLGASYEFTKENWPWLRKGSLNFFYDRIEFRYDDFRDLTSTEAAGTEPFYGFGANVMQFFLSVWF